MSKIREENYIFAVVEKCMDNNGDDKKDYPYQVVLVWPRKSGHAVKQRLDV